MELDLVHARKRASGAARISLRSWKLEFSHIFGSLCWKRGLVAHPASARCRMWAFLTLVFMLYEVAAITMEPFDAFSKQQKPILDCVAASFWTLDVIMNFFTGAYIRGKVEVRFRNIAKRYLYTWFALDVAIALMQWVTLFVSNGSILSSGGLLAKLARALRSLQIGRMWSWMESGISKMFSKRVSAFGTRILQCVTSLFVFVHINACLWYEIGKRDTGWVSESDKLGDSAGEKYLVCVHWSLSQLQGNIDIYPGKSVADRSFIVVSSFGSIIFLATLVSVMTDALGSAQEETKAMSREKTMVEAFFNRHHVKPALRERAEYYMRMRKTAQNSFGYVDQDCKALEIFPLQLRWRLLAEARAAILNWHPVFCFLESFHVVLFVHLCARSLMWQVCEPDDDIFTAGELSKCAYYISCGEFVLNTRFNLLSAVNPWLAELALDSNCVAGQVESEPYHSIVRANSATEEMSLEMKEEVPLDGPLSLNLLSQRTTSVTRLHKTQFVTEVALWAEWAHAGDMTATEHAQCFRIDSSELLTLVAEHRQPYEVCSSYAKRFVNAVVLFRSHRRSSEFVELMGFADVLDIEGDTSSES